MMYMFFIHQFVIWLARSSSHLPCGYVVQVQTVQLRVMAHQCHSTSNSNVVIYLEIVLQSEARHDPDDPTSWVRVAHCAQAALLDMPCCQCLAVADR